MAHQVHSNPNPDPDLIRAVHDWLESHQRELERQRQQRERNRRRWRRARIALAVLAVYGMFAAVWLAQSQDAPAWTSFVLAASNCFATTTTLWFVHLERNGARDNARAPEDERDVAPLGR